MRKSFLIRARDFGGLAVLSGLLWAQAAAADESARVARALSDACKGGRRYQSVSMFFSERIARSPVGTPLDVALRYERRQVEQARGEARLAFFIHPPDPFAGIMEEYTLLVPESLKDTYGVGMIVGLSEISSAIRYRRSLWRQMIEQFSTVKEAPSEDPYLLRFEVSLDLSFYCRYRQRIRDLVTQR